MNNTNFPQIRINKSPQKVSFLPIRINKSTLMFFLTFILHIFYTSNVSFKSIVIVTESVFVLFFAFSTTMSISPSFFSTILRKSCLMSWPYPRWFSLVFLPCFVLFPDPVSFLYACTTGGKAKNESRTSSSFGLA